MTKNEGLSLLVLCLPRIRAPNLDTYSSYLPPGCPPWPNPRMP